MIARGDAAIRGVLLTLSVLCAAGVGASFLALVVAHERSGRLQAAASNADRLLSDMKDIETSYRGYVIVGTAAYLEPYSRALRATEADVGALDAAPPAMAAQVAGLAALANEKKAFAKEVIAARGRSFEEARSLVETGRGKAIMDDLRGRVATIDADAAGSIAAGERGGLRAAVLAGSASFAGLVASAFFLASTYKRERGKTRRLQQLLEDVFQRAPVGLALVDRYGSLRQTNPAFAELVGASAESLQGARLSAVSRPLAEAVIPDLRAVTRGGAVAEPDRTERREAVEMFVGARSIFVDAAVFPVALSEDESASEAVGLVLTDMTRQREWEEELENERDRAESANRAKSAFIANMSHELRTPITAVLGYCELLEEEARDLGEETFVADLGKIATNARHLLGLINDVLDFSKMEAQKLEVHPIEFRLAEFLQEVESAIGGLTAKNGNVLSVSNEAGDSVILADDLRLRQILLNLLGNAAKFTRDGRIDLCVQAFERDGVDWLRFVVSDTGIGMSEAQVEGLFRRFSQVDQTTTRKYGGSGLGLALSKSIAELLGGAIAVESAPGRGSTFTVEMPQRHVAAARVLERSQEQAPQQDEARSAVLVIDDDPYAREFLARALERAGFSVLTESDGPSGLSTARSARPIAILLDVMLPGVDGWHVLRALRTDPQTADIPVIVQTVLDERNFAYALGAAAFLHKPIARDDLTATVSEFAPQATVGHALVVDDDLDAVARLAEMLERDGWSVARAHDGEEALAAMRRRKPALALVDLLMPGMDGYAFIRRVRAEAKFDDVRVIVLTADDVRGERVRALAGATSGVVQKGATPLADLVRDLRRFAARRRNDPGADASGD